MEPDRDNDSAEYLKEKILILRKESQFSAMKPVEPRKFIIIFQVFLLVVLGVSYYVNWNENPKDYDRLTIVSLLLSMQFLHTLIVVGNELSYKREYRLYREACDIIEFYKKEASTHSSYYDRDLEK